MLVKFVDGMFWNGANAWHSGHFFVTLSASLYMLCQYTPRHSIFPVSAHAPSCTPISPEWLSSRRAWHSLREMHLSHGARYPLSYNCFPFIENWGELIFICLASSRSSGRIPQCKLPRYGLFECGSSITASTLLLSILLSPSTSAIIFLVKWSQDVEANLLRASALVFFPLGICLILKLLNECASCYIFSRYLCILQSFAS